MKPDGHLKRKASKDKVYIMVQEANVGAETARYIRKETLNMDLQLGFVLQS